MNAAVARDGEREVVGRCLDVLAEGSADAVLLDVLGGTSAPWVLAGREGGLDGHWSRVWALRALLYAWDPCAVSAVIAACSHPHWRVREMSAKVLARRQITTDHAEVALDALTSDLNARVRAAAERALM